jgi:hypothetical protein
MKRNLISILVVALLAAAMITLQVAASPAVDSVYKSTKQTTPGAKATEKAIQKATDGIGKPEKTPKMTGKKVNLRGILASVDAVSLTLTQADGTLVTVALTTDTRVQIPNLGGNATLVDLLPGVKVVIQAAQAEDGTLTALKVSVTPGKPAKIHRVGEVTAYTPGASISILAKDGQTYTFVVTADTKLLPTDRSDKLAVGALVTIICPRDVTGGPLTAAGIVIHPAETIAD